MVAISMSGSGEGPGWVTAPGYSTTAFSDSRPISSAYVQFPRGPRAGREAVTRYSGSRRHEVAPSPVRSPDDRQLARESGRSARSAKRPT
jgi:hypothetical protein